METAAYLVGLFTRGTGAYTFTYAGPPGLSAGQVCAVNFRHKLELGIVLGIDDQRLDVELSPLLPVNLTGPQRWGELLLKLCELAVASPDEVAGHLLFDSAAAGLKLTFELVQPEHLPSWAAPDLAALSGKLTPTAKRQLCAKPVLTGTESLWQVTATAAWHGAVALQLGIAGLPGVTRESPQYRQWSELDPASAKLLGLSGEGGRFPGSFLAGFRQTIDLSHEPRARQPAEIEAVAGQPCVLSWDHLTWPAGWQVHRSIPQLGQVKLSRCQCNWETLRKQAGLQAWLANCLQANENVLVIVPQTWMLDRLWPGLAALAPRIHRYHASGSPGQCSYQLNRLQEPGQVIAGGPGAWKLAAYGQFDRVLLVDPSHPQFEADREPRLDIRLALLAALARRETKLNLLEFGVSAWDGTCQLKQATLLDPFSPPDDGPSTATTIDTDPLPLELRQATRRRLILFNRLGRSRGLACRECNTTLTCPACGSRNVFFSTASKSFQCGDCLESSAHWRCPKCRLASLSAQLPGLEAVHKRPGELLVTGAYPARSALHKIRAIIGTSSLLEPLSGFWPQDIIYVHADQAVGFLADWPRAIDTAARLTALYANPEYEGSYIVSARLREQLEPTLSQAEISTHWQTEMKLRSLANLPPYGCLYQLGVIARQAADIEIARELIGAKLSKHPATSLLRLSQAYHKPGGIRLGGYFANPEITYRELQQLRWEVQRSKAALSISAHIGPWL